MELWRRFHISEDLKKRIRKDLLYMGLIIIIIHAVIYVAYKQWGIKLQISIETQHYLYSSLIQAFAALSGLLLALMGFVYQRIRDREVIYLEDAVREATMLSLGQMPPDFGTIRDRIRGWFDTAHKMKVEQVRKLASACREMASDSESNRNKAHCMERLDEETTSLQNDVDRYSFISGLLARVDSLDRHFKTVTPISLILAVGSTLAVVVMSIMALAFSDFLGDYHAFCALTAVAIAGFSILYVVSFIRNMLHATYGIDSTPNFTTLQLSEPNEANQVLDESRKVLGNR